MAENYFQSPTIVVPYTPVAESISCIVEPSPSQGGVYISNYEAAVNATLLQNYNIRAVVTAAVEAEITYHQSLVPHHLKVPVQDYDSVSIDDYFESACEFIHQHLQKNTNVLVHCMVGMSRSTSLFIAYLIKHKFMTFDEAFLFVKSRRPITNPNPGFVRQLRAWQRNVHSQDVVRNRQHRLLQSQELSSPQIKPRIVQTAQHHHHHHHNQKHPSTHSAFTSPAHQQRDSLFMARSFSKILDSSTNIDQSSLSTRRMYPLSHSQVEDSRQRGSRTFGNMQQEVAKSRIEEDQKYVNNVLEDLARKYRSRNSVRQAWDPKKSYVITKPRHTNEPLRFSTELFSKTDYLPRHSNSPKHNTTGGSYILKNSNISNTRLFRG